MHGFHRIRPEIPIWIGRYRIRQERERICVKRRRLCSAHIRGLSLASRYSRRARRRERETARRPKCGSRRASCICGGRLSLNSAALGGADKINSNKFGGILGISVCLCLCERGRYTQERRRPAGFATQFRTIQASDQRYKRERVTAAPESGPAAAHTPDALARSTTRCTLIDFLIQLGSAAKLASARQIDLHIKSRGWASVALDLRSAPAAANWKRRRLSLNLGHYFCNYFKWYKN